MEVTIRKKDDEEFEFFLKMNAQKKQLITKVTPGGPADNAGLKENDELVEVNGKNVSKSTHEQTVNMIRDSIPTNKVHFKIRREAASKHSSAPKSNGTSSKPRVYKITKKDGSFGFNLKGFVARQKQAHIIEKITPGGVADVAGMRDDDRLVRVNKTNVEKLDHKQLVALIKKSGNTLTLMVVDAATYHHYKLAKKKFSVKDVTTLSTAVKAKKVVDALNHDESSVLAARQLHIVPSSDGMGFFLRSRNKIDEEFAGGLEKDGSGYICGLRENDRIIAVNGTSVHNKSHEEIVAMLKSNKHHVVLIVLSPKALRRVEGKGIGSLDDMETSKLEKPRLVKMTKGDDGYGFYMKMEQGRPYHILSDIEDGSTAEQAGLKNKEILASVNGECVMHKSHQSCVEKIKESGDQVSLVVASRETMSVFYKLKIDVTTELLVSWPKEDSFAKPTMTDFIEKRMASMKISEKKSEKEEEMIPMPRLCHLTKDQHSYSFYLRDEEGHHLLEQVEEGGAAHKAGVREGDYIVEVNGSSILDENHDEVVNRIRERKNSVTFLVVDDCARRYFSKKGVIITAKLLKSAGEAAEASEPPPQPRANLLKPRLCYLTKDRTFGFHLNSETTGPRPGQYVRQVAEGGVADVAGVKEGDRIIEINGENIEQKEHKEVVAMIVASGTKVNFLMVDEETDLHYRTIGVAITVMLLKDNDADDRRSISSSIHSVQAEATVHETPDHEHLSVVQSIEAVIDNEEAKEEIVEKIVEEAREEFVAEVLTEVIEECKDGSSGEEIREEIREEIVEEVREEIVETLVEEVVESRKEDAREEIVEEIREEIREEVVEEVREEIVETLVEEVVESRKEDAREEIVEEIREEIVEEFKEEVREQIIENAKEQLIEEVKQETEEDLKRKMREQMMAEAKKETQEEMMARLREEVKREMMAEAAATAISNIPAPPSPSTTPKKTAKPYVRSRSGSNASSNASSKQGSPPSIDLNEIRKVSLKPVNSRSRVEVTVAKAEEEPEKPRVRNSLRDRMSMFEQNNKSNNRNFRPAVKVAVARNAEVNATPAVKAHVTPSRGPKPFVFKSASTMKFNIVETTPIIN